MGFRYLSSNELLGEVASERADRIALARGNRYLDIDSGIKDFL